MSVDTFAGSTGRTRGVTTAERARTFTATLEPVTNGRARVVVPFDPDEAWGVKAEHRVGGTIAGMAVRGSLVCDDAGWSFSLGPAWLRDHPVGVGDEAVVTIAPEGPQRADLAPDLAAALDADPSAGAFFDTLAQFYRKAYLRWIDGTQNRPGVRAKRIAEMVALLHAGVKERPKP